MARRNLTPKRIATDIAGYGLCIAALIFGWLPGPGGIPLLVAGLGLLAINNDWAKRLLHYVRVHSERLRDVVFPDRPVIQWAWDIGVVGLLTAGTLITIYANAWYIRGFALPLYALSTVVFLFNRHRLRWFERKSKKLK